MADEPLEDTQAMSAEEVSAILDSTAADPGTNEAMHSTDDGESEQPRPADFEDDQGPEDRAPEPGNAPAPGERKSDSGSTPSDIETDGA